jgi:hypothetical protein
MGLPVLNQAVIAVDAGGETFSETATTEPAERADAALTARAVVAVSFTGAGFWYLLWKLALYFAAGR